MSVPPAAAGVSDLDIETTDETTNIIDSQVGKGACSRGFVMECNQRQQAAFPTFYLGKALHSPEAFS